jgi:hypothetical protein
LRPRMVGIQSQPMEAWQVGSSAPCTPPFGPVLCIVGTLMLPGVAFLMMRKASAFFAAGRMSDVASNFPRLKPPNIAVNPSVS